MHTKINWFEIPSVDFARATRFYESLFDTELKVEQSGPVKMGIFMDAAGNACGCVAHSEQFQPSAEGPVIYLDATPSIDRILARIEPAGGKIAMEKMELPDGLGFIGHFIDTEGNRLALHQLPSQDQHPDKSS
jgi:predicted enzyme related to lactoylglutathione lyase